MPLHEEWNRVSTRFYDLHKLLNLVGIDFRNTLTSLCACVFNIYFILILALYACIIYKWTVLVTLRILFIKMTFTAFNGVVGWCDGAGKVPVPVRPTIWITVGQGPTALAVGAGGGCLDIFTLICPFCHLSPSLWETTRYRLKYCLKGPLSSKQPTNQTNYAI